MATQGYLIDTNVLIEYLGASLPNKVLNILDEIFNILPCISIINKIELLGFNDITKKESIIFNELISAAFVIDLTDEIVKTTINLRKQHKIKLPDAIIAASAINTGLILLTRNTKDFNKIEGLDILSPYDLK